MVFMSADTEFNESQALLEAELEEQNERIPGNVIWGSDVIMDNLNEE